MKKSFKAEKSTLLINNVIILKTSQRIKLNLHIFLNKEIKKQKAKINFELEIPSKITKNPKDKYINK